MPKAKQKKDNLRLAGIFVFLVLGLIFLSLVFKLFLIIKNSNFDGNNKFNVLLVSNSAYDIVSFSPKTRSLSVVEYSLKNADSKLGSKIPIDGEIKVNGQINPRKLSGILLKSMFPLGNRVEGLTFLDLLRLSLFARTIPSDSVYVRNIDSLLSDSQIKTIFSLTFQDPTIYEENQTIEIINASSINGEGGKLAAFVANIGGNPILVTGSTTDEEKSKIIYYKSESYTVKRLSEYFNLPLEKSEKRGLADVIIIIGKDFKER